LGRIPAWGADDGEKPHIEENVLRMEVEIKPVVYQGFESARVDLGLGAKTHGTYGRARDRDYGRSPASDNGNLGTEQSPRS